MRPIQTAEGPETIWSRVSEDDFRKHLVALEERTNAVPVDVLTTISENVDEFNAGAGFLPLKVEKQIADDIAYIAAVTEGAQSVAAVCLEQYISQNEAALVVKIAGMDVVDEDVRAMLSDIVDLLQCVSQTTSSSEAEGARKATGKEQSEEIFKLIIAQHKQKLLGRLRSKKWTKPKHLSLTHKKSLWQDFENVIHRVQHVYPRKSERKIREEVGDQLLALSKVYEDFEGTEDNDQEKHLQALVRRTYTFCKQTGIRKFAARLEGVRATSQIAAAIKMLHQLEKIGAYWRISETLVTTASRYNHLFSNIKPQYLTPYASVPTSIAYESWAKTCHVHAEVQLVVDYALHIPGTGPREEEKVIWPRTIGTSKYLCYLCYLFLKYHSGFLMLNTHGRLYDQWTVPSLKEYDETTRAKFAGILVQMDKHICGQIEDAQEPVWRVEPMTSRQDLLCFDENDEVNEVEENLSSEMRNLRTE